MEPFVFIYRDNLHNTKITKSNNSQARRNKSKQIICLDLYIISVHVHLYQFESHLFTITIENLLRFLSNFDNKIISMKNFPLGFRLEVCSTHLFFLFFAQMWKHLKDKRLWKYSLPSWILPCGQQIQFIPGLLVHKILWVHLKMDRVWSCSSKTAEENKENIINLMYHRTDRTLNSLHQVSCNWISCWWS